MGRLIDVVTFGPQRRTRRMMRRLKRLDRDDAKLRAAGVDPLDAWRRSRDPRLGARPATDALSVRRRRPILMAIAVAAVVTGLVAWHSQLSAPTRSAAAAAARPRTIPPAGVDEQPERIGSPQSAPAGVGGYNFERTQADGTTPVAWDPCRPIHYVVSGTAPAGETDVVTSALSEVSQLTGFRFVSDGTTAELPTENRPAYQKVRYGNRWAPVLIAWTTPQQVPALSGDTIGLGGASAFSLRGGTSTYVSGIVYLDRPQYLESLANARGHDRTLAILRAVVLHELGHLLGLGHVTDPHSVMYPESTLTATDYSAGDRRGLHAESEGSCSPDL